MIDTTYRRRIQETPGAGRLGRHVQHDPHSRHYAYDTTGLTITAVRHTRHVPVFDQGDLGSCTGNAGVGALACDPLFTQLPVHPVFDENFAVVIYSDATTLDDDPDHYPPTDTGSTGLAAAKALQRAGLIGGYQHTFTLDGMLKALTKGTVFAGIDWPDSFDQPNARGQVKITAHAQVRGGHEICADEIVTGTGAGNWIGFTNSWSDQWGLGGRFYVSFDDMDTLLHRQGDVTVPILRPVAPIPPAGPTGPSGPPAPSADDVALWADMQKWARAKGLS